MIFRSRTSGHVSFHSPSPTGIASEFQERLDYNGVAYLEKVGSKDLNAIVQASKESTLVYNIIDRFENGDISALSKSKGFFGDFLGMPSSLAEAHNLIVGIESKFKELPLKIREAFGNSAQLFARKLQDGSYGEILGKIASSSDEILGSPTKDKVETDKEV